MESATTTSEPELAAGNGWPANIEELAAAARAQREQTCMQEVNQLLEKHNCALAIVVQLGEVHLPIAHVLTMPATVLIRSK